MFKLADHANKNDNAYSFILSLVISVGYLFATALVEEMAWKGFLFKRIADGGKRGLFQVRLAIFCFVIAYDI